MIPDAFITFCWLAFGAYWAVAAIFTKPSSESESILGRLWYGAFFALGFVLMLGLPPFDTYPLGVLLVPRSDAILSDVVMACGLALAVWARASIGSNWSGSVDFKKDHKLVVHGPYSYVRHPIYTAIILMLLATALYMGSLGSLLGLVPCFISFWIKLTKEEKLMIRHFPREYPQYRGRVKALVPFVF